MRTIKLQVEDKDYESFLTILKRISGVVRVELIAME